MARGTDTKEADGSTAASENHEELAVPGRWHRAAARM